MMITLRSILDEIVEHNCVNSCDKYYMPFNDMNAIDSLATTIANLNERQDHQSEMSCAVVVFESIDKTKFIMSGVSVSEDQDGIPFYNIKVVLHNDDGMPGDAIDSRYNSLAINKLWYKLHNLCRDIRYSCRMICDTLV